MGWKFETPVGIGFASLRGEVEVDVNHRVGGVHERQRRGARSRRAGKKPSYELQTRSRNADFIQEGPATSKVNDFESGRRESRCNVDCHISEHRLSRLARRRGTNATVDWKGKGLSRLDVIGI